MAMNKQRKMLIGVLLLGIGGLGIDRFVIGTPDAAAADDSDSVDQAPPEFEPIVAEEAGPQRSDEQGGELPSFASLAERLVLAQERQATTLESSERSDPFALPVQWQSDKSSPSVSSGDSISLNRVSINGVFKLDGTVRSVIDNKEEMLAVISGAGLDGRAIRIGQKIRFPNGDGTAEEYLLVEVGSRYVVWKSLGNGQRVVMKVEEVL